MRLMKFIVQLLLKFKFYILFYLFSIINKLCISSIFLVLFLSTKCPGTHQVYQEQGFLIFIERCFEEKWKENTNLSTQQ